jgi:hypothetical protein
MWLRDLDELGERVCELYPFLCELCDKMGHFNFQCQLIERARQICIVMIRLLSINMMSLLCF